MRDYTSNNYCDFLWNSDLLKLKKNASNAFSVEVREGGKLKTITIINVTVFGTIVEIKQLKDKEFLYRLDDGTGVIACKHNEEQFEEAIRFIENENVDILNQTFESQQRLEQSCVSNFSADDSVFNDRSVQLEEINFNKRGRFKDLQSMWDDICKSFYSLIEPYSIGDTVIIQGKLYTYFNENQIYVNNIRAIDITEEMMLLTIKLDDDLDESVNMSSRKVHPDSEKRLSGLITFDNIPHLSSNFSNCRNIETPIPKDDLLNITPNIVTPNLKSTITFDTFTNGM